MTTYIVYFEIGDKKLKMEIEAKTTDEVIYLLRGKLKINKIEPKLGDTDIFNTIFNGFK
jgi:hypothetical protein